LFDLLACFLMAQMNITSHSCCAIKTADGSWMALISAGASLSVGNAASFVQNSSGADGGGWMEFTAGS
jgi:hypothetical protein